MTPHDVISAAEGVEHEVPTLLCFSHLRWGFVHQRPQHLMARAARSRRVIFWEEPSYEDPVTSPGPLPRLDLIPTEAGPIVALPLLPDGMDEVASIGAQRRLLDGLIRERRISNPLLWYYTPQTLAFSRHLRGRPVVYDCMDELSAFNGADPALPCANGS